MTEKEVKRRTGFKDRNTLLAYIVVICNGDFNRVRMRCTVLTWFEKWVMYFEWSYGQTNLRTNDLQQAWDINHKYINMVKDSKCALEVAAFKSWPQFPSYDKDLLLRS